MVLAPLKSLPDHNFASAYIMDVALKAWFLFYSLNVKCTDPSDHSRHRNDAKRRRHEIDADTRCGATP